MRKTLFLSEAKPIENHSKYKFMAEYTFYRGKWYSDSWYFNDYNEIREKAKTQGYLIK